jgi:hypothetical protein
MIRIKRIEKIDEFIIVQKEEMDLFEKLADICNPANKKVEVRLFKERISAS